MARESKNIALPFPVRGINVMAPRVAQPESTCVDALNIRIFDQLEGRARGGMRPGLSKYTPSQINGTNRVQDLNCATVIKDVAPSSCSLGVRTVVAVAVSAGVIHTFDDTAVSAASASGSRTLSATAPFIFSAELFGRVYYTDGESYKIWVGANNTATDWTPSAGSLPGTDGTVTPRLIEMWRSRIVLSGLRTDPHNWFMSEVGDPLDWDYSPATVTEIQAVQGGVGVVGKVGDVINCMIPYSDDVLIFGCDHSIWQLSGDPQSAAGRIDLLSDTIGMAFGRPYCVDAAGTVYFFSSRGHVYSLERGTGSLTPMTVNVIAPLLSETELDRTFVRMAWDDAQQGFYLFITPFLSI